MDGDLCRDTKVGFLEFIDKLCPYDNASLLKRCKIDEQQPGSCSIQRTSDNISDDTSTP